MAETIIKYNRLKENKKDVSSILLNSNVINAAMANATINNTGSSTIADSHWVNSYGVNSLVPKESENSAEGENSVAIGTETLTLNEGEFAIGTFNLPTSGETLFTIGDGEDDINRHNVLSVGKQQSTFNNEVLINSSLSGYSADFSNSLTSPIISGLSGTFTDSVNSSSISGDNATLSNSLSVPSLSGYNATLSNSLTVPSISGNNATFTNTVKANTFSGSTATLNNVNVSNKITTNKLEAVSGYIQTLLSEDITVDNLTVTKAAHFFKLIIDEIKATQGQIIITPANAIIDKVETVNNNYRCYFRSKQDEKEISNMFETNDQIVCQTFNAASGVSYNVSNTYYWRLCVGTGTTSTTINGEIVDCHYIDLSNTDKDTYSNAAPKEGDNIVQLGNRSDSTRQTAIIISAYNTQFLDKNIKAPSIVQYYGINDYNLENHRRNVISRDFNEFRGTFKTSNGNDIEDLIDDVTSGSTAYLHTAWANSADGSSGFTKTPNGGSYAYIGFCSNNNASDTSLIYSDYTWCYVKGDSGTNGTNGNDGNDGVSIIGVTEYYLISSSSGGVTTATTGWQTTFIAPTSSKKYLWCYQQIYYSNNTSSKSVPVIIGNYAKNGEDGASGYTPYIVDNYWYINGVNTGVKALGQDGLNGTNGVDGASGTSSYFHVAYCNKTTAGTITDFSTSDPTNRDYIGTYVDSTLADSTTPSNYTWQLVKGAQGEKGEQGISGTSGANGQTSYLHIKYSNDGGNSFTSNNGEDAGKYLGQYVDFNSADSTNVTAYTWALIKGQDGTNGNDGISITGVTEYYLISSSSGSVTTATTGWQTTFIAPTSSKKYLWNYEQIHYSNNTSTKTTPIIIGNYAKNGTDGNDGRGISAITEYYRTHTASTNITTASTGWSTAIPTLTSTNKYLWNYEQITYTDGETANTQAVVIGVYGDKGEKGDKGDSGTSVSVTATSVTYAKTTATTQPSDNAITSTTIPSLSSGDYLWSKTIVSYSNGTSTKSYSVSRIGSDGENGTNGTNGVNGKDSYLHIAYALSSNGSSGFSTTYFNGALFIGTCTNNTSADPTTYNSYTWARLKGEQGEQGASGISVSITSTSVTYAVTTSSTQPADSKFTYNTIPTVSKGQYLWTKTIVSYSDGNSTKTYTVSYQGSDGENGTNGTNGVNGNDGADAEFYRLVPTVEKAIVDKNGTLGVQLQYLIEHVSGSTVTTESAKTNGYWIRFKCDNNNTYYSLSTGSTPSYTNTSFITNYHTQNSKPIYLQVYLVSGSNATVIEQKIVSVIFDAAATLEITDSITSTVQGHTTSISNLQDELDNIDVGGTQLLRGTNSSSYTTDSSSSWSNGTWKLSSTSNCTASNFDLSDSPNELVIVGWRLVNNTTTGTRYILQAKFPIQANQAYTVSGWYRVGEGSSNNSINTRVLVYNDTNSSTIKGLSGTCTSTTWTYFSFSFTTTEAQAQGNVSVRFGNYGSGVLEYCAMKLEKGNVATDWSECPLDINSQFATVTNSVSQISQKADSISATVETHTTQINTASGNITTLQGDVSTLKQTASSITTTVSSHTTSINSISGTVSCHTTSISNLENQLDNFVIGGTQILRGTNNADSLLKSGTPLWENGTWYSAGSGSGVLSTFTLTDSPNPLLNVGWKISNNASNTRYFQQRRVPFKGGQLYTVSGWVRVANGSANSSLTYSVRIYNFNSSTTVATVVSDTISTTAWTYFVGSFTLTDTQADNAAFRVGVGSTNGNIDFCGLKLEKGNVATDWSECPLDVTSEITTISESVSNISQRADSIEATVSGHTTQINSANGNISTLQDNVSALQQTASGISATVSSHTTSITNHTNNINSLSGTVSGHTNQLNTASGNITTLQNDVSNLKQTASSITTTVSSHTTSITNHTNNINSLSGTVSGHTSQINTANGNITTLQNDVSNLKQTASGISATVSSHTTTITNHTNNINSISGTVTGHSNTLSNQQNDINSISGTVTGHTDTLTNQQNEINNISGKVTSHTTSIAELTLTSDSMQSSITTINGKLQHKNYFSFNRGIKPYNSTCMLLPYQYGFCGWGSTDRIVNFGFTSEDSGNDWTLVFDIKSSASVTVTPKFCNTSSNAVFKNTTQQSTSTKLTATTTWTTYRVMFSNITSSYLTDSTYNGYLNFGKSTSSTVIYLRNIALVKGTYPTLQFEKGEEDLNYQGGQQPFKWNLENLTTNGTYKGLTVYQNSVKPTTSGGYYDFIYHNNFSIKDKTPYTLSFWAKADLTNVRISSYFYNSSWNLHVNKGDLENNGEDGRWYTDLTTEWKHYTVHWYPHTASLTGTSAQQYIKNILALRLENISGYSNSGATVSIAGVTFQEGWIDDAASTHSSLIQQTADNILMQVGSCGINIDEQNITLNGDTNINGTLTLTDENQGFILAGDGGRTQITPQSIGDYTAFTANSSSVLNIYKSYGQFLPITSDGATATTASWITTNEFGIVPSGTYIPLTTQTSTFRKEFTTITPTSISNTYKIYVGDTLVSTITNSSQTVSSVGSYTTTAKGALRIDRVTTATFRTSDLSGGDGSYYIIGTITYKVTIPKEKFTLLGFDGFACNFGTNTSVYFGASGAYLRYGDYGLNISSSGIKKLSGSSWIPLNNMKVVRTSSSSYSIPNGVDMVVTTSSSNQAVIFPLPSSHSGRVIYVKCNSSTAPTMYCNSTSNSTAYFLRPGDGSTKDVSFNLGGNTEVFISDGNSWIRGYMG